MIVKIKAICDDISDVHTEELTEEKFKEEVLYWDDLENRGIIDYRIKEVSDNEVHVTIYY